jgi:hypothetical protein
MNATQEAESQAALNEIAMRIRDVVVAETYERVASIPMLAHYTSVKALKSILQSRELRFSRSQDMNDTSEIIGGIAIIASGLAQYGPKIFVAPPYAELDAGQQFEARRSMLETDTYVLSLSEHGSDEETDRLGMWRAYGHNGNGLCLVLRKDTLLGQKAQGKFAVQWSPIDYETPTQLNERLRQRLEQIEGVFRALPNAVAAVPAPLLGMLIAQCAVPLVLAHKHIAFKEEREIRFVRSRILQPLVPPEGAGYRIVNETGTPKSVFILPLRNYPEFPVNAGLPELLDHIIIGPSYQQEEIYREVRDSLDAHGLTQVRILRSEIPYRASR